MKDWRRKQGIRKSGDSADIVITKYTVAVETAKAIKRAASDYGSQGRALQVATEMLIRMEDLPLRTKVRPGPRPGDRRLHQGAQPEADQDLTPIAHCFADSGKIVLIRNT